MNKRYDITSPRTFKDRDGNDRTAWVRLGTAFDKDGKITLLFDALPIPGPDGVCKAILMEPREQGGKQQDSRPTGAERREFRSAAGIMRDLDDQVPF